MNRNKKLTRTMAAAMAGVLLAQSGAGCVYAQEDEAAKQETVYIKTDASGEKEEVIVSEWLKNNSGSDTISDTTQLQEIENVKGEETFTQDGDKLIWDADGKDIYYQGTTDKELPVSAAITYYLDGAEIAPEELAGKSGHVKIRYQYKNQAKAGEVYTPFAMVTGMVLPGEKFRNVTVTNGRVLSDGEKMIVVGMGLPGLYDSLQLQTRKDFKDLKIPDTFELEADVTDFELTMSMTAASTLSMDELGLDDVQDVDDLRDKITELTDGATKLVDGSGELSDGVQTLQDACTELLDGMNAVDENMGTLADGIGTLNAKKQDLIDGINALADGIHTLDSKKGTLIQGAKDLDAGTRQLKAGAKAAKSGSKTLAEGAGLLQLGTGELAHGEGRKKLTDGGAQLVDGSAALAAGSKTLAEGSSELKVGSKALADGSAALLTGVNTMLQQAQDTDMKGGAQQLADGSAAFAAMLQSYTGGVDALLRALSASDPEHPEQNGYMSSVNAYIDGVNQVFDQILKAQAQPGAGSANAAANEAVQAEASLAAAQEAQPETVTKTAIDEQSLADIQAVLGELQSVQTTLGNATPEQLVSMSAQYPAYVAKLENCIRLLQGVQTEQVAVAVPGAASQGVQAAAVQPAAATVSETAGAGGASGNAAAGNAELAGAIMQLQQAGAALKAQSTPDEQNPTIQNAVDALSGTTELGGQQVPLGTALNTSAKALADGAEKLNAGVGAVFDGVEKQLQPGAEQLADGAEKLYDGMTGLNEGAKTLQGGVEALHGGASHLKAGLDTLFTGADTIAEKMQQLAAGASTLADGNRQLYDGASALAKGTGTLNTGAGALGAGVGQLANGAGKLQSGAGTLSSGIAQLADGSTQLKDGTAKLSDGGVQLSDGVDDLADGADELKEGMEKFDEEGIREISDFVNDEVLDLLDRLELVKDAGADYTLFGDPETAGTVKFIMETGAIKAE